MAGRILWAQVVIEGSEGSGGVDLSLALLGEDAPDISVIESLARLQMVCQRSGLRVRLEQTCTMLEELLELAGLAGVIESGGVIGLGAVAGSGAVGRSVGEMVWEPECPEKLFGIEERVDPRDAVT